MAHDARHIAADILAQLELTDLRGEFCCYGTGDSLLLGIGRTSSLELSDYGSLERVWKQVDDFITRHADDYIMGFLGFDPANELDKAIVDSRKRADLFVPELVVECDRHGFQVLKGTPPDTFTIGKKAHDLDSTPLDISTIDEEPAEPTGHTGRYLDAVAAVIDSINAGDLERATLARKIVSPWPFDLSKTFLSDMSQHELSRSFYFSNDQLAFAGQSPELLADGTVSVFTTHKLSGTCARQPRMTTKQLADEFRTDPRIVAEHHSAIATIEHNLASLGEIEADRFQVMELPTLLHGWSRFTTRPTAGTRPADCLRRIFPYGINPVEVGFELLKRYEDFERGPYYGLIGCIRPDGQFTFSQVLRTAFTEAMRPDRSRSYVMVGAAITSLSTPALELTETRTKLNGIRLYHAQRDDSHVKRSSSSG